MSKPHELPTLVPRLAWKQLVEHLMAEHEIKHKFRFADAIDVCHQTMSRWLGDTPPMPEPGSFKKVADFAGISEGALSYRWWYFMKEHCAPYQHDLGLERESPEKAVYDYGHNLLEQAKALEGLDFTNVPPEQVPILHRHRQEILELIREIEGLRKQVTSRLRSMLTSFREIYDSAVHTTLRMRLSRRGDPPQPSSSSATG